MEDKIIKEFESIGYSLMEVRNKKFYIFRKDNIDLIIEIIIHEKQVSS